MLLDEELRGRPAPPTPRRSSRPSGILAMADDDFRPVAFRRARCTGSRPACATTSWSTRSSGRALARDAHRALRRRDVAAAGRRDGPGPRLRHGPRGRRGGIRGQIFNVVGKNYRILELAQWVQRALAAGVEGRDRRRLLVPEGPHLPRLRREVQTVLGVKTRVTVKESVEHMVREIRRRGHGLLPPALLQHRVDDAARGDRGDGAPSRLRPLPAGACGRRRGVRTPRAGPPAGPTRRLGARAVCSSWAGGGSSGRT